jgi:hypothetical protein
MDEDLSVFFLIPYDVILYCCDKDFSKKKSSLRVTRQVDLNVNRGCKKELLMR